MLIIMLSALHALFVPHNLALICIDYVTVEEKWNHRKEK